MHMDEASGLKCGWAIVSGVPRLAVSRKLPVLNSSATADAIAPAVVQYYVMGAVDEPGAPGMSCHVTAI